MGRLRRLEAKGEISSKESPLFGILVLDDRHFPTLVLPRSGAKGSNAQHSSQHVAPLVAL